VATSPEKLEFGSGTPLVTSNGTAPGSGIVWISQCTKPPGCAGSTLNAYAAVPVGGAPKLLWSGPIGVSTKFARPDASDGRIYVGTRDGHVLGFGATHHTLAVARQVEAGGSVSSDVPGIACGSSCSHSYADGAQVTLTATPAAQFEFSGWSGGGCSGAGSCLVTMHSDVAVTAHFAPSAVSAGPGTGVTPIPAAPRTKLTKVTIAPANGKATFRFGSIGGNTGFQCRLIRPGVRRHTKPPAFSRCSSPITYVHLVPGSYTFEVRAINPAGPDPTPLRRKFKI
jgi:hypothetical protein